MREPSICSTYDPSTPSPAVASASHGHCLVLDAGASADPQSGTAGLTYRYSLVGNPAPIVGSSAQTLVPGATLRTLPLGSVTFRVDVTDADLNTGFAETSVELFNSPPVARVDPPRTYPQGGFPWAFSTDTSFRVSFHGDASFDVDDDPIVSWCWSLPPSNIEDCTLPANVDDWPFPVFLSGPQTAKLRVIDSIGDTSPTVETVVDIGSPNLWVAPYPNSNFQTGIARIDQERLTAGSDVLQALPLPGSANEFIRPTVAAIDVGTNELELIGGSDNVLATAAVPTVPDGMEIDDDRTIRVISESHGGGSSGQRDIQTWSASTGVFLTPDPMHPTVAVLTSALEDLLTPQIHSMALPHTHLAFDGTRLWYGESEGPRVWIAAVDGSPLAIDSLPPGSSLTGLGRRPGSDEIWAIEGQRNGNPSVGEIAIVRYRWIGSLQRQVWAFTDANDARGLVWSDADHFWMARHGLTDALGGVCRFDVNVLTNGAVDPADASDSCVPDDSYVIPGGPTPDGGSFWQNLATRSLLEIEPGGAATIEGDSTGIVETRTPPFDRLIQPNANFNGQPLVLSRSDAFDGTLFRDQSAAIISRPDWWGGGFWEVQSFPARLLRRAEDGTVIDEIDRLRLPDGTDTPLRAMTALASDSAGLWSYESFETSAFVPYITRIDLRNRPAANEATLEFEHPVGYLQDTLPGAVFDARKIGGAGLWAESLPFFSTIPTVEQIDAQGNATPVFAVPGNEASGCIAQVDEYDGSLFLASVAATSPPVLRLRRISLAGVVTTPLTATLPSGATLHAMNVIVNLGSATIWVATEVPGSPNPTATITAYDVGGIARNTFTEAGPTILSMSGPSRDEVWLLRQGSGTEGIPERINFYGSSAPTTTDYLGASADLQYFLVP